MKSKKTLTLVIVMWIIAILSIAVIMANYYSCLELLVFQLLLNEHDSLRQNYEALEKSDSRLLKQLLDKPLTDKEVPTVEALQTWLWCEDQTNMIRPTNPDFICGDYALMLAIHARAKHWDMGVVSIWGYDEDAGKNYAHVLNAIITIEGLVYVEPQTDEVWSYENHGEIRVGSVYKIGEKSVYVKGVKVILQY